VDFLKMIGGRVLTAVLALAVVAGAISWWRMGENERDAVLSASALGGAWLLVVLLMPWLLFWVAGRVARLDSNLAGAVLIIVLTAIEAAWLGILFGVSGHSMATWALLAAAIVVAGVYNLFACDWIAEKVK
jgi:hypothetical protein